MQDGRLYFKTYNLVNTGYAVSVDAHGRVPADCIPNGHLVRQERIKVGIIKCRGEIRKIQGVIILLNVGRIDMWSFEAFLAHHDYASCPEFNPGWVIFWGHRMHMWARRVLIDYRNIEHIDENTSELLATLLTIKRDTT